MVLCHRKLGPVKKVEVEDEISMKKRIRESGRKLLAFIISWVGQKYTVIVSTLLTDCWPHTYVRIQPPAEKHVLCMHIQPPPEKQWGCPTYDNAQLMIITLVDLRGIAKLSKHQISPDRQQALPVLQLDNAPRLQPDLKTSARPQVKPHH